MTDASTPLTSRRSVLAAAGAVSLATAVTACGSSDDGAAAGAPDSGDDSGAQTSEAPAQDGNSAPAEGGSGGGRELGRAADIPEGGGMVFKDQKVVVTQPSAGEYKAFSAVCTHQGCLVSSVTDGSINCACHGSRFAIADGSVQGGPATRPLEAANVTVEGDSVRLG